MAVAQAAELPLLLAERYRGDVDVSRYWVSEKLDGVRAYWDGKQLRFRSGNPVHAPDWFVAVLPSQPLDGELWIARGTFDRLSGIVRRTTPDDAEWRLLRYMIFELPEASGDFTERIERIKTVIEQAGVPWLQAVEQFRLSDNKALNRKLDEVVRAGGEGLMLHLAEAPYLIGRSQALLKVTSWYDAEAPYLIGRSQALLKVTSWYDAEARVIAHLPGKGKHAGRLGALRVEMPDGRQFSLGSGFADDQRSDPPAIGTFVTYRYRELTRNGIPRFPHFLRVRETF